MSIVTHKQSIVPAVWPAELGRASCGAFDLQVQSNWRYVPDTFDGICDWASVEKENDDGNDVYSFGRRLLVYQPSVLPEGYRASMQVVVVVLQGFLGEFNISPLGDWDKRDKTASSALQTLTLESGGEKDAFGAQVRALRDLRAYISAKVGMPLHDVAEEDARIYLERPVFTKVREFAKQPDAVRLSSASDPGGRAQKLAAQWRVDHLIRTGVRRQSGHDMEIAYTALREGDFVEVSVYADVQIVRRYKRTGAVIRFAMTDVVRLWTAEEAKGRFVRTDIDDDGAEDREAKSIVMPSVFNMGAAVKGGMVIE